MSGSPKFPLKVRKKTSSPNQCDNNESIYVLEENQCVKHLKGAMAGEGDFNYDYYSRNKAASSSNSASMNANSNFCVSCGKELTISFPLSLSASVDSFPSNSTSTSILDSTAAEQKNAAAFMTKSTNCDRDHVVGGDSGTIYTRSTEYISHIENRSETRIYCSCIKNALHRQKSESRIEGDNGKCQYQDESPLIFMESHRNCGSFCSCSREKVISVKGKDRNIIEGKGNNLDDGERDNHSGHGITNNKFIKDATDSSPQNQHQQNHPSHEICTISVCDNIYNNGCNPLPVSSVREPAPAPAQTKTETGTPLGEMSIDALKSDSVLHNNTSTHTDYGEADAIDKDKNQNFLVSASDSSTNKYQSQCQKFAASDALEPKPKQDAAIQLISKASFLLPTTTDAHKGTQIEGGSQKDENEPESDTEEIGYTLSEWNLDNALDNMREISDMYQEKLDWINDASIERNCESSLCANSNLKGKLNLFELWVEDLKEQNGVLREIVQEMDHKSQRDINNYKTALVKLSQRYQVNESLTQALQTQVVRFRVKALQLDEENQLIKKSSLAWETSNRIVREKLKHSDDEIDKLVTLLSRIRDFSKWDLTDIHFAPEIHSQIFGNHPHLPNSTLFGRAFYSSAIISSSSNTNCHLSDSHTSFMFQEKCAELEAAKEELEKFSTQELTKDQLYQKSLKDLKDLEIKLLKANLQLKLYHNKLEETKGKIRVYCRIRPAPTPTATLSPPSDFPGGIFKQKNTLTMPFKLNESLSPSHCTITGPAPSPGTGPDSSSGYYPSTSGSAHQSVVNFLDEFTVGVEIGKEKALKEFQFDRVFHSQNCQEEIFSETKSLIQSGFDGFNVCIAAYGQTGSGKTFTILGDKNNPGLAPRTSTKLFSIASASSHLFISSISVYVVELYNQKLIDLLANTTPTEEEATAINATATTVNRKHTNISKTPTSDSFFASGAGSGDATLSTAAEVGDEGHVRGNGNENRRHVPGIGSSPAPAPAPAPVAAEGDKLEIRRDVNGTVFVQGARVITVEDGQTLLNWLEAALKSRHTSQTSMNNSSSRSHLIIGIKIENTSRLNGSVTRGKISLVDLAGSERQRKMSCSTSSVLQESTNINKSLSALEHVIVSLTTEQGHVPYRNNKLTELMQDSIGGNAKTLFFINVSPLKSNLDETVVSLNYGSRIKNVVNDAVRNSCNSNRSN